MAREQITLKTVNDEIMHGYHWKKENITKL